MNKKNRQTALLAVMVMLSPALFAQSRLKQGDNLNDYFKKNTGSFAFNKKVSAKNQTKDMHVMLTGHKQLKKGSPSVLSVKVGTNKTYLFGIIQGTGEKSHFMVDMNGDGKLDTVTEELMLPYWIYFPLTIPRGANPQYTKMLDDMYAAFQYDGGPMDPESTMKKGLNNLQDALSKSETPNRDLFYAMDFYIAYNSTYRAATLECLKTLIVETGKRYKKKHPLLYLYLVQTLVKLDRLPEALKVNTLLLDMAPDCITALAYAYKLEKDPEKAKEKLQKLKKKHPHHWIVKTL